MGVNPFFLFRFVVPPLGGKVPIRITA